MDTTSIFAHFWKLREEINISSSQADLYYYLIHKSIGFGRKYTFQLSNKFICLHLGMSEKSLIACRNGLKQAGLIDFVSGKQNKIRSTYELMYWKMVSTQGSTADSTGDSTQGSTADSTEGEKAPDKIYYNNNLNNNKQTNLNKKEQPPSENISEPEVLDIPPLPDESSMRKKATQTGGAAQIDVLIFPYDTPNFRNMWSKWNDHRKNIRKPYKSLEAQQAALKQLSEFDEPYAIGLIGRSMAGGYQGLTFGQDTRNDYQKYLKSKSYAGNNQTNGERLNAENAVRLARLLAQ